MGLRGKKPDLRSGQSESDADSAKDADSNQHAQAAGNGTSRDADFSNLDESSADPSNNGNVAADSTENTKLKAELADTRDKYLRALADLENYRKRAQKERSELIRYQGESILVDILEIVDGLERALEHARDESGKLTEGVRLIHKQFVDALAKWEVRPDAALGKPFDPNKQRALAKAKGEKSGIVIGELKKAYFYRDKLLRVGEVVVSEGGDSATSGDQASGGPSSSDDGADSGDPSNTDKAEGN